MPQTLHCARTGKTYEVSDLELRLCTRFGVPPPELHPEERLRELMAFRNEWKLYKRTCDATGEAIVSAYRTDSPFKVYKNAIWWGDTWDGAEYGRDFDFSRPFFEQFAELQNVVPREGTSVFNSENCDYNSHIRNSRNCYLNSLAAKCEDTHYSYWVVNDHDLLDCAYTNNSTRCYDSTDLEACYECVCIQEAKDCADCHFSFQLQNCKHCLFSANLINAEYRVFNKPVTPAEFETMKKELFNGSFSTYQKAKEKFLELRKNAVHRASHLINCENSTGDHLLDSKNCQNCFDGQTNEDGVNSVSLGDSKDVASSLSTGWPRSEMIYRSVVSRGANTIAFCNYTYFSSNLYYCDSVQSSQDCFGCIGLKKKRYCILNKQYSKEDYRTVARNIIEHMQKTGEWGKFFPASLSPFSYNESAANDFFPLEREQAMQLGYGWTEQEQKAPEVSETIPATQLPDSLSEVTDDMLTKPVVCSETGKLYRVMAKELQFYRQMSLPIPRLHPEARHRWRMSLRNPLRLLNRTCFRCGEKTLSTTPVDRPEKIFCEACYRAHLYG